MHKPQVLLRGYKEPLNSKSVKHIEFNFLTNVIR